MSRIWSLAEARHPSTVDGADLLPGGHVGLIAETTLIGPQAVYAGTYRGHIPSQLMEAGTNDDKPGGYIAVLAHLDDPAAGQG